MAMSITLNIPNNIHEALHIPPAETERRLKLELPDASLPIGRERRPPEAKPQR